MARTRRARGTHRCKGRDATGRILKGWALDRRSGKLYRTTSRPAASRPAASSTTRTASAPPRKPAARSKRRSGVELATTRAWRNLVNAPGNQLDLF